VPVQYSAAALAVKLVGANVAAAVQLLAVGQDTPQSPVRLPDCALAGLGVGWIAQVLPFQCSASVWNTPMAGALFPTAVQLAGEEQATAARLASGFAGLGVRWAVQVLPFQCSARVSWLPSGGTGSWRPTAVQLVPRCTTPRTAGCAAAWGWPGWTRCGRSSAPLARS